MNRMEAVDVLRTIAALYPKFHVTDRLGKIWIPQLEKMDYAGVMDNLSTFAAYHPYPPTLAEIASYLPEPNRLEEKMKVWEEEAQKVPESLKEHFRKEFEKLMEELAAK